MLLQQLLLIHTHIESTGSRLGSCWRLLVPSVCLSVCLRLRLCLRRRHRRRHMAPSRLGTARAWVNRSNAGNSGTISRRASQAIGQLSRRLQGARARERKYRFCPWQIHCTRQRWLKRWLKTADSALKSKVNCNSIHSYYLLEVWILIIPKCIKWMSAWPTFLVRIQLFLFGKDVGRWFICLSINLPVEWQLSSTAPSSKDIAPGESTHKLITLHR